MVELGGEFGTVTGRRRRCGWLDLVALKYAVRVNGLTELAMTKLDILSHFETLKVGVAYDSLGERFGEFPRQQRILYNCHPVYEELPGWNTDISEVRLFSDLPKEAQQYIEYVESVIEIPVSMIGVGPARDATVMRQS